MKGGGTVLTENGIADVKIKIKDTNADIRKAIREGNTKKAQNLEVKRSALESLLEERSTDFAENAKLNAVLDYFLDKSGTSYNAAMQNEVNSDVQFSDKRVDLTQYSLKMMRIILSILRKDSIVLL